MKKWKSLKEMQNDILDLSFGECLELCSALLEDYSSFIAAYKIPINIDTFISHYWNILTYEDFLDLTPGDKCYMSYGNERFVETEITTFPCFDDETETYFVSGQFTDKQRAEIISTTWTYQVGQLYSESIPYAGYSNKTRKDVDNQWKAHLITKTSQVQS